LMIGVMTIRWWISRQMRRVVRLYGRVLADMQMRQWPAAVATLETLMRDPVESPDMRSVMLMWLTELATRAGRHEAAVAALDEVLAVGAGAMYHQNAMAEKALALLRVQRLTDATALLDRLRTMDLAEPTATLAEVGQLYRRIRARSFSSIADDADALAARARVVFHRQAAYVYALIALGLEQVGQVDRAQAYYDCATRLMSPAELARRFGELGPLSERLVPARSPM
jgi:tetratricopeptide (TPR) repeat protein